MRENSKCKTPLVRGFLFATTAMAAILTASCSGDEQKVLTQEFAVMDIEPSKSSLDQSYPATIRGTQDIEIRSNVEGFVIKQLVEEGASVKMGQVLFEIDPSIYEANYNLALADVEAAKTEVATTKLTAENKANLANKGIISDYEKQLAFNKYESSVAGLKQAEANLKREKSNLDYTFVKSPADGVVGTIPLKVGSLVGPNTETPLTIVSKIDMVDAYFSLNEKQMLDVTSAAEGSLDKVPDVKLRLADGKIHPASGRIRTISGVIDVNTGAVSVKARFDNPNRALRSGSTGAVLIPYVNDSALIIPQSATFEMQDKKFVCTVNDSNVVSNREIKVLAQNDGENYVVTDGLAIGERIVIEGIGVSVKDGMKIVPISAESAKAKLDKAITTTKESAKE